MADVAVSSPEDYRVKLTMLRSALDSGNMSADILTELVVALLTDAGSRGDIWKGRATRFVAALTHALVYLRDNGFITLSPDKYLDCLELPVVEELAWERHDSYGAMFEVYAAPLRSYLTTLPGYQKDKLKQQDQKVVERHGFVVLQLTRIFKDLILDHGRA